MRRLLCSIAILIGLALPCAAQQAVLQSGPWAQGHAPLYVGQGSSQPVVQDSGTAAGGALGTGLTELGLTIFNPNLTPPYANAGTGPYGTNFCDYDAPTNNATGFHYLCFSPNAQGGGLIAYGAGGVASPLPLQFIINGIVYPFGNIPANCTTPNGIAYYLTGGGVGCSSGITASNTALTLGSGVTFTLPDSSTWTSSGLSMLGTIAATPTIVWSGSATNPPTTPAVFRAMKIFRNFHRARWLAVKSEQHRDNRQS